MKVLNFDIDLDLLACNQERLSNLILSYMLDQSPSVFNWLDYSNNSVFLEPLLFNYFLQKHDSRAYTIEQAVLGYNSGSNLPKTIRVISNQEGIVYLPKLGYIQQNFSQKEFVIETEAIFDLASEYPLFKAPNTSIEIYRHIPDIVVSLEKEKLIEAAEETFLGHIKVVCHSIGRMKVFMPDLFSLIERVTRNLSIFNSATQNSFAAINQHGTAFINLENKKQSEVFFIDDIAHQCGHIIFNILTLDVENYIKIPKTTFLSQLNVNSDDHRTVYSAFHGLFTYTCILHSLDKCLDSGLFKNNLKLKKEVYARIGFYLSKFSFDLSYLNHRFIFTEAGWSFLEDFAYGYKRILKKYEHVTQVFDYSNQPYNFNFQKFEYINKSNPTLNHKNQSE